MIDSHHLRDHLENEFIPFLLERTPDPEHGGYNLRVDWRGEAGARRRRILVGQARQLYVFSVGARRIRGETGRRCLEAAGLGRTFLLGKMHDPEHGGFYSSVARDGRIVRDTKSTYGNAFAVYALAEYHLASGDPEALSTAVRTHDLFREKMWDRENGGLYRSATRDWKVTDDRKKIDDHLHFLEGVWNLWAATREERYREEIAELSEFILQAFFTGPRLEEIELVRRDLSPDPRTRNVYDRAGHAMEAAWFLLRAARLLDRDDLRRPALRIVDTVLEDSYDAEHGGIVLWPGKGDRSWWVQCEAVAALSIAWKDTGEERYREAFEKVAAFTLSSFPDRDHGGWYRMVSRTGRREDKVQPWNAGYHVTQMLAYVSDLLDGKDPDA